jgi:hypothetical protein
LLHCYTSHALISSGSRELLNLGKTERHQLLARAIRAHLELAHVLLLAWQLVSLLWWQRLLMLKMLQGLLGLDLLLRLQGTLLHLLRLLGLLNLLRLWRLLLSWATGPLFLYWALAPASFDFHMAPMLGFLSLLTLDILVLDSVYGCNSQLKLGENPQSFGRRHFAVLGLK